MSVTASTSTASSIADSNNGPPEVSVTLLKTDDLPEVSVAWDHVELPIDILLLTAKLCETMSCLTYLREPSLHKSYHIDLGYVYFGEMGKDEVIKALKIAVIECSPGSVVPGGSIVSVKNAVTVLNPKAVFCVGYCAGLNKNKVKLGDVVVSAKLRTYASIKITESGIQERGIGVPLKKHLGDLIRTAHHGWKAPLKHQGQLEVKVHCDGVFLSGPEVVDEKERRAGLAKRFPDAIAIEMEAEGESFQRWST